jgi:hypothetical protein
MRVGFAMLSLVLSLLVGCAVPDTHELDMAEARCKAAGARAELGKTVDDAVSDSARASAGALRARIIKPGDAVTQDIDPQRLNIEVDDTGRIRRLRCG